MRKFNKSLKEYEEINAPLKLKERVEKTMKLERNKTKLLNSIVSTAACLVIGIVACVNLMPSFAFAMSSNPVLAPIIKVITLGRYEYKENGYEAKIATPKIEGLLDKELENKLNEEFKEYASSIIVAFENEVKELKKEFGDEEHYLWQECNYEVKTNNDKNLAIDVWFAHTAGGPASITHKFYTIDKKSGNLITLKSIFKESADYTTPISNYIIKEMLKKNNEENALYWIGIQENGIKGFEKIAEDQKFYINDAGNIVICFDKYEVAAGAQGCSEFEIPYDVIVDIIK